MAELAAPGVQPKVFSSWRDWWSRARTSFLWMVIVAFALRFGYIVIHQTYKFKTQDNNFSFGFEMGRIGRAIATGQGFADPFEGHTGPTAWEPPVYPYLIAGVFKIAGVYTPTSALILLSLNSLFSALTCIPLFLIARKCFSEKVAVGTAWLWALLPSVMYWCTRWVWETSLAALILAVIFWLTLQLEEAQGIKPWIIFGLLWGVAALTNTSLLSFLPASGLWAWYRHHKQKLLTAKIAQNGRKDREEGQRFASFAESWRALRLKAFENGVQSLASVVVASVFFLATIAPWLVRNYETFGKFIFIRSNFGAELRLGNGPFADGVWMQWLHPSQNVVELHRYQQLGELEYVATRKREATNFIRASYPRFAWLSIKRFIYYWGGLPRSSAIAGLAPFKNSLFLASSVLAFWGLARALRKRKHGASLFLWLLLTYPTIYYFVFPHPRYRHPIEPELGILIVYILAEAEIRSFRRQKSA